MKHQIDSRKLNLRAPHRTALIRNQAIILIEHGHLTSTKAQVREVRRFVEKLVTLARTGNDFNTLRRAKMLMPYKAETLKKLFADIAPKYVNRPGGYTRIIPLGRRVSDTAEIARIEWV